MSFFDQENIDSFLSELGITYRGVCMRTINKPLYIINCATKDKKKCSLDKNGKPVVYKKDNYIESYDSYKKCASGAGEVIYVPVKTCNRYEGDTLFQGYLQKTCLGEINKEVGLKYTTIDYVLMYIDDTFKGILIAKKNECENKYRDTDKRRKTRKENIDDYWSVKLICAEGGTGGILMALYLDAILYRKNEFVQEYGFLELAQGYANVAGFCSYSKFGFEKDTGLICNEYDQISNANNLKMSCDLNKHKIDRDMLIKIALKKYKIFDHDVCDTKKMSTEKQLEKMRQFQTEYENEINKLREIEQSLVTTQYKDTDEFKEYVQNTKNWKNVDDIEIILNPKINNHEIEGRSMRSFKKTKLGFGRSKKKKSKKKSKRSKKSKKKSKRRY